MRTISVGLQAHVEDALPRTIAYLLKITRKNGTIIYLTSHQEDLVVGGQTYSADGGFKPSAFNSGLSGSISTGRVELTLTATSDIQPEDIRDGLFDSARAEFSACNFMDVTQGKVIILNGFVATVRFTDRSRQHARMEIRGLLDLGRQIVTEVYSAMCRADLGDSVCRVPILPADVARSTAYTLNSYVRKQQSGSYQNRIYKVTTAGTTSAGAVTYSTTLGATTTDGTAVMTAVDAWLREATVASVIDGHRFTIAVTEARAVDGWFAQGGVIWRTGNNTGLQMEVTEWVQSSSRVKLLLPMARDVQVGDTLDIFPGCDKRIATCISKFDNSLNFKGEPHGGAQEIGTDDV